jgi:hypothetical protein
MKAKKNKSTFFFGLLKKRECWGLSWKGWLLGIFSAICCFTFLLKNTYPFLAPTERLDSKILVVEGWLNDDSLKQAFDEFRLHNYDHIYVTGGPLDSGSFLSNFKTHANLGASSLTKLGIPGKNITAVPGPRSIKDRTYTSALALKKYFEENIVNVNSFNLFSEGSHSKRSQLLFNLAFENKVKIGIIPAKPYSYDPQSWWSSSAGFRSIFNELIAYPYALFFKYSKLGTL